jgi:hypothetical protein
MAARTVVTVSHGADFFGVDTYPAAALVKIAEYVSYLVHGRADLTQVLQRAGEVDQRVPADQAAVFSEALRRVARNRGVKALVARQARALSDAAARAAADGETWTLTPVTTGEVIA